MDGLPRQTLSSFVKPLPTSASWLPTWIQQRSLNHMVRHAEPKRLRKGFRVNEQYKGALSYGSVDEDDFEEARRIRRAFNSAIGDASERSERRFSEARKRLRAVYAKQRVRSPRKSPSTSEKSDSTETEDGNPTVMAATDQAADDAIDAETETAAEVLNEASLDALDVSDSSQVEASATSDFHSSVASGAKDAFAPAGTVSRATVDGKPSWDGWPEPMALEAAKTLAEGELNKPAKVLQAGARSLSSAGEHALAARLLDELRGSGVQREVLERRLSLSQADELFQTTCIYLGLELSRARMRSEAWEALMAICAEPELKSKNQKPAMKALLGVTNALLKSGLRDPQQEVKFLEGAVDAELVLKALGTSRREKLEMNLALSLQRAGREAESRRLLQYLLSNAGSSIKGQAQFALMVQDADIGDEPQEAVVAMKSIFSDGMAKLDRSSPRLGAAAAVAGKTGQQGRSGNFGINGAQGVLLALALLVLPLALPILLSKGTP